MLKCGPLNSKTKEDAYLLCSPQHKTTQKQKTTPKQNPAWVGGWLVFSLFSFLKADVSTTSHLFYRQEFLLKAKHSELIHTNIWTSSLFAE